MSRYESEGGLTVNTLWWCMVAGAGMWVMGILFVFAVFGLASCQPAAASEIPATAKHYQRTLIRAAQMHWGLDAPVATMAAQVHQESRWNAEARSAVGAEGLAQFMPATSDWFAEMYPAHLGERQPYNPGWALRALVLYDRWLYVRLNASNDCEHWAMVLAAYNGGLGWVLRDKHTASAEGADPLQWFDATERFNAGRSDSAFHENRSYPRLILLRWEPLYTRGGWGRGVCQTVML